MRESGFRSSGTDSVLVRSQRRSSSSWRGKPYWNHTKWLGSWQSHQVLNVRIIACHCTPDLKLTTGGCVGRAGSEQSTIAPQATAEAEVALYRLLVETGKHRGKHVQKS